MGDGTGGQKRDYIWNTAAGLINAAEAVVMSMVVTRVTGLADAGMLTMAFAVGNLMMTVGKFGVRNYQVTDVGNQFSFSDYLAARLMTVLAMIVTVGTYLGYMLVRAGYSLNKTGIVFAICMIYAVEALEDLIWGYYQQKGKLYAGACMFCLRWGGILLLFPIVLYSSHNLAHTLWICLGVSAVTFLILLCVSYPRLCSREDRLSELIREKADWRQAWKLLRTVFPLFGISFLSFYENNAPKYAIDSCLSDEVQACYGFVAMPVFVIGLLNNLIYQPTLVPMAVEWEQGKRGQFGKRIARQLVVIAALTIACMGGAYLLGIPVLSLLYNTDLTAYKGELMVLLLASAFLATSGYQSVVLTIIRCQRVLLLPHCVVAIIAAVGLPFIVAKYGTMGAAVCYLALMILLTLTYAGILIIKLRGSKR